MDSRNTATQAQNTGKTSKVVQNMRTNEHRTRSEIVALVQSGELTPGYLLTVNADAKTIKGLKYGYLTGILYGTPANGSGLWNDCVFASTQCIFACLNTAGHGGIGLDDENLNDVTRARLVRSAFFHKQRDAFWTFLIKDIKRVIRHAARLGLRPAIRLNGTTDVKWESTPVTKNGIRIANNIFELFEDVQFYDYTKYPYSKRPNSSLPVNYHLTFSRSETNGADIAENLENGRNVAVVFGISSTDSAPLPSEWEGGPVLDGGLSDLRFKDASGHVVGLKFKDSKGIGKATTKAQRMQDAIDGGFVVQV